MNRTTKAMARLATLAVIAGGALSAPFAIGTANATVAIVAATPVNGTVTSVEDAGTQSSYPNDGLVRWTSPDPNTTISLSGTGAYFIAGANQATDTGSNGDATPGNVTVTSPTTAKCALSPCAAHVGDSVAEAVTAFIADPTDASSATTTVSFNGIFISGCPSTGLDTGVVGGVAYGTPPNTTPQNCVTQGQFGQPLTLSATYLAGGTGVVQNTKVQLTTPVNAQFSGSQPAGCLFFTTTEVDCASDATGKFSFTIVDNGSGTPPPAEQPIITVTTRGGTGSYPPIIAAPPAPTELINFGTGGVTPTRVDVTGGLVIVPSNGGTSVQNVSASHLAEPGDVEQGTFLVEGSCPTTGTNQNCDTGTPLAGVTVTVTVDHGFITPNCTNNGFTSYAECSFASAPTAGSAVGNLTNSGQSATFVTGINGTFKASFAIAKDALFDSTGIVPIHVTVAGLPTLLPGPLAGGITCSSPMYVDPVIPGGIGGPIVVGTPHPGCPIDGAFTTNEQPLNGGSAKLAVVPSLSSPNNVAIISENNSNATDSGTINVPDVNRVVFTVVLQDQYTNRTSNAGAGGANRATLTKTGPGQLWNCGAAFTTTDACVGGGGNALRTSNTQNADGTFTEVYTALGSFTNAAGQNRYQIDTMPNGSGAGNAGYGSVTPSVGDGTTTVVLSWTPPTTTFASFHAGNPAIATFQAGNGAAETDTLTIAFYNQLSQPVVTFTVKPGNTVGTSTAVTVQATVIDQNGNPIVMGPWPNSVAIQVVRSGGNESSCTPIQNAANQFLFTNTSGVAGYTFSCDAPGLSTVSMVVTGPGGVALASGQEAVTFTGAPPVSKIVERPTLSASSHHRGNLHLTVVTHPAVGHARVNVYRLRNGLPHRIGALGTNGSGVGHATFHGFRPGARLHIEVLVTGLGAGYNSKYSRVVTVRIHR